MAKKYRFVNEQAYQGKDYGIAITGNANGFVYNKKIWTQAGITTDPKTPAEFLSDLKPDQDQDVGDPALHQLPGRLAADPVGEQPWRRAAPTRPP